MAFSRALKKYGAEAFVLHHVTMPQATSLETLNLVEERLITHFGSLSPRGYNLRTGGKNATVCEATRAKISRANKGRCPSPETRAKIAASHIGIKPSEEALAKMRVAQVGRKRIFSPTHRANLAAAHQARDYTNLRGRPCPLEVREKIRASRIGRPIHSEESRRKIGLAGIGRVPVNKGKKMSEEVRAKMRGPRKPSQRVKEHLAKLAIARRLKKVRENSREAA